MTQPEELRIGNYIVFMEDETVAKVIGIHTNPAGVDVQFEEEETYIELREFAPIELTEEILLKCGFYWDIPVQKYCDGNWCVRLNHSGTFDISYIKSHNTFIPFWFNASPKYLHELQNIYYWLTKTELEVKL